MARGTVIGCGLLAMACQLAPAKAPAVAVDAGPKPPRVVSVKLSGGIKDIVGDDPWPTSSGRLSDSHSLELPLDLSVVLPSGRAWRTPAKRVTSLLDDARTTVARVNVWVADVANCEAGAELALENLAALGVNEKFRAVRPKPGLTPSYPVEGCISVEVQMFPRSRGACSLYMETANWGPQMWQHRSGWPDTCRPDGGT